jgi:hypothetical protein
VRGAKGRFDGTHHVVGHQRHAKAQQGRLGITQRLDLALERLLHLLEGGFNRPATTINIGNLLCIGRPERYVRQQMNLGVAVPGRLVQDYRDASPEEHLARGIGGPKALLEDRPRGASALGLALAHERVEQGRTVLTDHERTLPRGDPEQEAGGAEVAVGDPKILRRDRVHDLIQQRPFLSMAVFAEYDIGGQHPLRFEDDQGVTGQGPGPHRPQFLDPVLGLGQVVAVEDLGAIAGQKRRHAGSHGRADGPEPLGRRPDHGCGDGRLDAFDLTVQRGERGGEGHGVLGVSGVDGGLDAADDHAHQFDDRREQQFAGVLPVGEVFEELVEDARIESILHQGLRHDGDGIALGKSFERFAVNHGDCLPTKWITPWRMAV